MSTPTHAVIDMDCFKYRIANGGEKKIITATHKASKKAYKFETMTKWYGHYKTKNGGILAELNKDSSSLLMPEDFDYELEQIPIPLDHCLKNVKLAINKALAMSGAKTYHGYIGRGASWRREASTILEYKGNRKNLVKPVHLEAVEDYMLEHQNTTAVSHWEADEVVVWDCLKDKNSFAIFEDKDFWGCPIKGFSLLMPERGIVECNKFGDLRKEKVGKEYEYFGEGRMWLYFQIASGDGVDNYKANSASETKWGPASAHKVLAEATNDKEAFKKLVEIYKHLYPEPRTITGWCGNEIKVDWLYALEENFTLARMYRHKDDHVKIKDVLDKLGIS